MFAVPINNRNGDYVGEFVVAHSAATATLPIQPENIKWCGSNILTVKLRKICLLFYNYYFFQYRFWYLSYANTQYTSNITFLFR